ncbi:MAG: hypothetical protein QM610_02025 [Chitinophagaceae bacterium]
MKRNKKNITILDVLLTILSVFFIFIGILHFKHIQSLQIKMGLSHFFSPNLVGILSFIVPILDVFTGVSILLLNAPKIALWTGMVISTAYLIYNIALYAMTGNDCGCANVFFDINLKCQIFLFSLMIIFIIFSINICGSNRND